MSQNQDSSTWSATDAKDNQQEIAKMVSDSRIFVHPFFNFFTIKILIVSCFSFARTHAYRLIIYPSKKTVRQRLKKMVLMLQIKVSTHKC